MRSVFLQIDRDGEYGLGKSECAKKREHREKHCGIRENRNNESENERGCRFFGTNAVLQGTLNSSQQTKMINDANAGIAASKTAPATVQDRNEARFLIES